METINDRITKEDVKDVAGSIGLVITETEAEVVLLVLLIGIKIK